MSKPSRSREASHWHTALRVWSEESQAVMSLRNSISRQAFEKCVKAIAGCRGKIFVTGLGTSMAAARKIAHSLCCIERPAAFLSPGDGVHGGMGAVQKGDVVIAISKGGNTPEILNILPAVKAKKAFLIGVTESEESVLARKSNLILKVKIQREPDPFNMLATASTMAVVAVFDAVCIALMEHMSYTQKQFAVIHPHGAVGERLLKGGK